MGTLHRNPHFAVIHHVASRYVELARTATPFDSRDDARRSLEQCGAALAAIDVAELGILLDWRLAPLSTDPELHKIIVDTTDLFARRFRRRALLVQTPVGTMQGERIVRVESGTNPAVYNHKEAAVAYVTGR